MPRQNGSKQRGFTQQTMIEHSFNGTQTWVACSYIKVVTIDKSKSEHWKEKVVNQAETFYFNMVAWFYVGISDTLFRDVVFPAQ